MRRDLSYRTSIEYIILLSVYIFISIILIFWTLDFKARIFKPEEKEKIHHLAMCFFACFSSRLFPSSLASHSIRFAFRSQVTKRKVIQCYSRGKSNGPIVKRKGYEGVGGRTFAEIENRTPAMKYALRFCRFSTLLGDSSYPPSLCFPP